MCKDNYIKIKTQIIEEFIDIFSFCLCLLRRIMYIIEHLLILESVRLEQTKLNRHSLKSKVFKRDHGIMI